MRRGRLIWEDAIIDRIEPKELGDLMATLAENAVMEGAKVEADTKVNAVNAWLTVE